MVNLTLACDAGNCILQLWNYSSASRPCKCPMCSSSITNLTPEASFFNQQDSQVLEVLQSVERYNRLYVGGALGLVQKLRESPLLIKRVVMRIMDPDGPDYIHEARLLAVIQMIMTLIYVLCPFDFLPISELSWEPSMVSCYTHCISPIRLT
ncbi:E3 ubiquitin-protein ligase RNF170 [Linum perenne]